MTHDGIFLPLVTFSTMSTLEKKKLLGSETAIVQMTPIAELAHKVILACELDLHTTESSSVRN